MNWHDQVQVPPNGGSDVAQNNVGPLVLCVEGAPVAIIF